MWDIEFIIELEVCTSWIIFVIFFFGYTNSSMVGVRTEWIFWFWIVRRRTSAIILFKIRFSRICLSWISTFHPNFTTSQFQKSSYFCWVFFFFEFISRIVSLSTEKVHWNLGCKFSSRWWPCMVLATGVTEIEKDISMDLFKAPAQRPTFTQRWRCAVKISKNRTNEQFQNFNPIINSKKYHFAYLYFWRDRICLNFINPFK